jgi:hypothetical protein
LAQAGQLLPMLALFDDRNALATDAQGLKQALSAVAKIDAERAALRTASAERRRQAIRIGHEIAVGSGMLALASSVGWLVFG